MPEANVQDLDEGGICNITSYLDNTVVEDMRNSHKVAAVMFK